MLKLRGVGGRGGRRRGASASGGRQEERNSSGTALARSEVVVAGGHPGGVRDHSREGREVRVVEVRRHLEVVGEAQHLVRVREVEPARKSTRGGT